MPTECAAASAPATWDELEAQRQRHRREAALGPCPGGEVAALGVLRLEIERRALEIPVEDADDVVAAAEGLFHQPEEGDLALQALEVLGLVAELEHPALAGLAVVGEPHLAEAAFAELLPQQPMAAAGQRLAGGGAPAEHPGLCAARDAPRFLRARRRGQRSEPFGADLEDFDRLLDAAHEVGTVSQPTQRLAGRRRAGAGAAGEIEGAPGEQCLARPGERRETRDQRLGEPFDLERLGTARHVLRRIGAQVDLPQVQPGARRQLDPELGSKAGDRPVVGEGVGDGA